MATPTTESNDAISYLMHHLIPLAIPVPNQLRPLPPVPNQLRALLSKPSKRLLVAIYQPKHS